MTSRVCVGALSFILLPGELAGSVVLITASIVRIVASIHGIIGQDIPFFPHCYDHKAQCPITATMEIDTTQPRMCARLSIFHCKQHQR
mmetsp:Transcript_699/g.1014  ORF Transcript_699/g.1014 Transcript_699/m.1014 type:complete len:88 (+) Transcript_699:395-658(+)